MQGEKLSRGIFDKVLLILLVLVLGYIAFVYVHPTYRLRVDMPADFLDTPASLSPDKRAAEEKLARAYWYCVVTVIQHNYRYGDPLPLAPPPEFKITESLAGAKDPNARLRYWHRLQRLWYEGGSWSQGQLTDFGWLTDGAKSSWQWVRYCSDKIFGR